MSSKDPTVRLNDIVENAERIEEYMRGLNEASFGADRKTVDATERCLERIAEAVVKIGAERMSSIAPDVPVEQVRGLGNMLRHAYDVVDFRILFDMIQHDIPALKQAALRALED